MQVVGIIPESYLGAVRPYKWVRCCRHIFMYRKYYVKHTSKQCNLDRLKSGLKKGHKKERKKEWATLFKHHWKHFVRGGLINTTTFKEQENNAVGRSTLPESSETLTHQWHRFSLVKKESKTGAYRYRHDGYGDTPG